MESRSNWITKLMLTLALSACATEGATPEPGPTSNTPMRDDREEIASQAQALTTGLSIKRSATISAPSGWTKFGAAVDIEYDSIVVASGTTSTGGAFAVYERSGSAFPRSTVTGMPTNVARLGASVAACGSNVVVGSPEENKVYIYRKTNGAWSVWKTLTGTGKFGSAVDCSRDAEKIVVGAPEANSGKGAAWLYEPSWYYYEKTEFGTSTQLTNASLATGDKLGTVVLADTVAAATNPTKGEVYIFDEFNRTLSRLPYTLGGWFWCPIDFASAGTALALKNETILIGAPKSSSWVYDWGVTNSCLETKGIGNVYGYRWPGGKTPINTSVLMGTGASDAYGSPLASHNDFIAAGSASSIRITYNNSSSYAWKPWGQSTSWQIAAIANTNNSVVAGDTRNNKVYVASFGLPDGSTCASGEACANSCVNGSCCLAAGENYVACGGPQCTDGIDNDNDGKLDCDDEACLGKTPACPNCYAPNACVSEPLCATKAPCYLP